MPRRLSRSSGFLVIGLGMAVVAGALAVSVRPVATHPRITTTLLWNKEIAPILQRRCFSCHTPDNVAFPLTTYAEARPWAQAIREEILTRHMPPWVAVPGYGRFANDPGLTQGEWDLLVAWVDGGAPSGQTLAEEQTAAVFVPAGAAWEAGEPSVTLAMPDAHDVAARAGDFVRRVEVPTLLKAATRVRGLAFKPGNRRVVRYAAVREAGTNRWLFTWTPWATHMMLPEGTAYVLPAGARLVVDIGYRGGDTPTTDRSEVGLYLDEATGGDAARVDVVEAVPAGTPDGGGVRRLRGELVLTGAGAVHALWPQPVPGVTSVEVTAYQPDGQVRPLLWLRGYRPDWPSPYVYADPVFLPRGTKLVLTAYAAGVGTLSGPVPQVSVVRVPGASTTR